MHSRGLPASCDPEQVQHDIGIGIGYPVYTLTYTLYTLYICAPRFALEEARIALLRLCQRFTFELEPGQARRPAAPGVAAPSAGRPDAEVLVCGRSLLQAERSRACAWALVAGAGRGAWCLCWSARCVSARYDAWVMTKD